MGDKSGIQWTEATWNPVVGCSVVSPGCTNCYAMKQAHRLARMGGKGGAKYAGLIDLVKGKPVWNGTVRLHEAALDQPLRWKKPRLIFVNSMSDLFHEDVSFDVIDRIFAVMALCPQHIFQVLTKRGDRMRQYITEERASFAGIVLGPFEMVRAAMLRGWPDLSRSKDHPHGAVGMPWPLPNVWLGVSVEDQRRWNERREHLRDTPAAVRFVSAEPLLGPIDFGRDLLWLDWVIVGGESGPSARACDVDWLRGLVKQCADADCPVFVKQFGGNPVAASYVPAYSEPYWITHGKGGDMSEWPVDLRVRQMPKAA